MGPGKPNSRRSSRSSLELKSDCLQLPETANSDGDNSDSLVRNLKAEYLEVSQQLNSVRDQLSALQRERQDALKKEQEAAARQLETLLQETRKVQRERDDMVAVNKLLLRHKRASTTTQAELEAVKIEQVQLQRHQEELEQTLKDLQAQLAEQSAAAEESREQVNQLRHEKEMLALQWQELQEEHRDTQNQVDELHDRLVDAQRAHRAVEVVLAALRTAHAAKAQQVRDLQAALEAANARVVVAPPPEDAGIPVIAHALTLLPQAEPNSATSSQPLRERLEDANLDLNQHRDELLAAFSCHDLQLQQLQEQVRALELVNSTSKQILASLHEELREAQNRERNMRGAFSTEIEVVRKKVEQDAQTAHNDLRRQIRELEQRCEGERAEKTRLQAAVDELESASQARAAARAKEQGFLAQFKHQLENGIVVTKFGARGVPHQRVVYSDTQCTWLSWRSPATSVTHGSLTQPKADAKVDTCDLVEVLPGATTETFARQRPDAPARCFSLVFVHPGRTLDLQADTAAQCQTYLRGFRLLQEEAAHKRR
jgi:chromosome segregation ATPase